MGKYQKDEENFGDILWKCIRRSALSLVPQLATVVTFWLVSHSKLKLNDPGVSSAVSSAIAGYSFTALFFLLALPKSHYIGWLNKYGFFMWYTLTISSPAMFSLAHLILLGFGSGFSIWFYFMEIYQFLGSFVILIIVAFRSSKWDGINSGGR